MYVFAQHTNNETGFSQTTSFVVTCCAQCSQYTCYHLYLW